MTREQQLWTTLNWIHTNVEYAYVQNGAWAQITNKSYVDAIFTYRKGQCIQYNAAIASMMAYLGYDVNLVQAGSAASAISTSGARCISTAKHT